MIWFTVLAIIGIFIIIAIVYLKQHPNIPAPTVPVAEHYLGKVFTLDYPVINGTGILQIDKVTWRISCVDLPAGARIKIVNTDALVLIAEPNQN